MRSQQVSFAAVLCVALSLSAFASDVRLNQLPPATFDQIAKLTAPDGETNDYFGTSVAIDGSTIVVGKGRANLNSAFVYENNSGVVTQVAELTPSNGEAGDNFGYSVAISGNTIVVSSRSHKNSDPVNYGVEYVYLEPASGWTNMTETAQLNLAQAGASVGSIVATNGSEVVAINTNNGTAVIWNEPAEGWVSSSKPNAELTDTALTSLASVAISGNVIVAASPDAYQFGVTFVYVKPAGGWNKIGITETARLVGTNAGALVTAISGNTVSTAAGSTGIYVFVKPPGGWADMNQTALLTNDGAYGVAVSGGTVVSGNPYQLVGVNPQQGAAYVYEEPSGGWKNMSTASAEIVASDGNINDQLGTSVAVSGGTVVAGAPQAQIGENLDEGAAYVFGQQ